MNVPAGPLPKAGRSLSEEIGTPALLVDARGLDANIAAMAAACAGRRQRLRPHVKTHKCAEIARRQIAAGAVGVSCAKLSEAEAMADHGIADLLITTPVVGAGKPRRLAALATRARVIAVADSEACIAAYAAAAAAAGVVLETLVEVNVGQDRCGVAPGPAAAHLAAFIGAFPALRFAGLQGYQGRAQGIGGFAERKAAIARAADLLTVAADAVRAAGLPVGILTGGGTGSLAFDLAGDLLTELQPGSYVFMDTSYLGLDWDGAGAPPPFANALTVLTTVVSRVRPDRAIVDAGWKAISSDSGLPAVMGRDDLVFDFAGDEHGTLARRDGGPLDLAVGDTVELVPSHCDTTVALHDRLFVVAADGGIARWAVDARGRFD
ncbi:DSD1 family PLP-dependent enzyme [Aquabacter spiritensis]|uniref:D-serine deaminase-like pyridoxal phosphate-dependent protein n=1 Tax=Aquabacter spiritensis TaxID=933073 RepID=A0A4R3LUU6_9HYPH|nr:DSD1 family PLP-dependent enzyme [Aquabacter spiritensis]TCT04380.1 D-serine deaminase-like pyridoxal phosphate-dependent protein [Aquabacter spiritensis]